MLELINDIVIMLYCINVMIYITVDKGGNNELIKLVESLGITRFRFVTFFQNAILIFSIITIILGCIKLIFSLKTYLGF